MAMTKEEAAAAKKAADTAAALAAAEAAGATGNFAAKLVAMRAELEAAAGALSDIAKSASQAKAVAGAGAFSTGSKFSASPWAKPESSSPYGAASDAAAEKSRRAMTASIEAFKKERDAAKASEKAKKDSANGGAGSGLGASAKLLAKKAGISKTALRAPIAAGALNLSQMALGIRGMAMLGAVEQRAAMNFRSLFKGIDPMPVVRGADRFLQVFNKSSVTGKTLEGIFQRSFTSLFQSLEKLAPYAQTAFQGMVLGALYLEEGWLRARIALFPLTEAIGNFIDPTTRMEIAAASGGIAVAAMGYAAAGAAAPFLAAAAAVGALIVQVQALDKEWDSSSFGQIKKKFALDTGDKSRGDQEKEQQGDSRQAYEAAQLRFAKERAAKAAAGGAPPGTTTAEPTGAPENTAAAGKVDGKAFADGVVSGMLEGVPAVTAAGVVVAQAADAGVRSGGEIKSPSKLTRETGREFPAGTALGIRDGAGEVQAAADASMVPQTGGGGGQRGASAQAPAKIEITIINQWPAGVATAARADIETMVDVAIHKAVRAALQSLAMPVGLSS